jgi:hypothetical protein
MSHLAAPRLAGFLTRYDAFFRSDQLRESEPHWYTVGWILGYLAIPAIVVMIIALAWIVVRLRSHHEEESQPWTAASTHPASPPR